MLKRKNSVLSKDCERYIDEVSMISIERGKFSDKINNYKTEIKVRL